ncbi:hypothetical protein [Reticulibacter mediterranei]|nr:hypothetical protein [Reticulibacter mediterranei]
MKRQRQANREAKQRDHMLPGQLEEMVKKREGENSTRQITTRRAKTPG